MPKHILNVTDQPVSIMFCGRELFHVHKVFPLLGLESVLSHTLQLFLILDFGFNYLVFFLKIL